jgi:hypothetical protein
MGQANVGGHIATRGDDLVTLEVDGSLGSLTVGGGIHAEGRRSDGIRIRGGNLDLTGVAMSAAHGRRIVRAQTSSSARA